MGEVDICRFNLKNRDKVYFFENKNYTRFRTSDIVILSRFVVTSEFADTISCGKSKKV